ncbi:MAG: phosphocholine-specific phospholipase C, partial [Bryobacteraceae bacterium]
EHVVVYMQENRAFDHYLGTLNGIRGFGDPRPVRLPGGRSVWQQPSQEHPDGYVMPFHGDSRTTKAYTVDGSGQSHQDNLTILNHGRYDRWGKTKELHKRMVYYTAADLPFYYALASAFTVCDAYHCSTLTQTYPNRLHLISGCNGGGKVGGDPIMSNAGTDETPNADMDTQKPFRAYTWIPYALRLQKAGISWKVYQEYDNFNDNLLPLFKSFRNVSKNSILYKRGRSWVSEDAKNPADRTRSDGKQLLATFRKDLADETLPQVSWIVDAAELSEHPDHIPARGEHLTSQFVQALVDHPKMFAKTVFFILYDETGGMFDHVSPPVPPIHRSDGYSTMPIAGEIKHYKPGTEENTGPQPIGLGMRVPAMIVSPWSRGGWVSSEVFDHTSVLKFLEKRFGVRAENIDSWRRAVCGDLTSCFDFQTPNQDWTTLTLPSTADYLARIARSLHGATLRIPAKQAPTNQERQQRLARPLPYELHAEGAEDREGKFSIALANAGKTGAAFQIYDYNDREGPWRYTIEAGKRYMASPWRKSSAAVGYDLVVHGPNGFFRRYRSKSGSSNLKIVTRYQGGALVLALSNEGPAPLECRVAQADVYPVGRGQSRVRNHRLEAGSSLSDLWNLAASDRWYDLSLTLPQDQTFLYRYAGCVETGKPGKTDPAIGPMRLDEV